MKGDKRAEDVYSGAHKRRTEDRLVAGGFVLLLVVGGLLTILLLGTGPAAITIGVILLAAGLFLGIYHGLGLLETWLKRE